MAKSISELGERKFIQLSTSMARSNFGEHVARKRTQQLPSFSRIAEQRDDCGIVPCLVILAACGSDSSPSQAQLSVTQHRGLSLVGFFFIQFFISGSLLDPRRFRKFSRWQ